MQCYGLFVCIQLLLIRSSLQSTDEDVASGANPGRICAGCPEEKDANDDVYRSLAKDSLTKFAKDSGITQYYKITRMNSASSQVVSGSLIRLNFDAIPTNCELETSAETSCEILDEAQEINCRAKIWEQPWLNKKEITISCDEKHRQKRSKLAGGVSNVNPDDPEYFKLAQESLQQFVKENGLTQHHELLKVTNAGRQVVAGSKIILDFDAIPTDCPPNPTTTCTILDPSQTIKCHSEIWQRPWLNLKDITVTCGNKNVA